MKAVHPDNIEKVISIVRTNKEVSEAKKQIIEFLEVEEIQAQAILDLSLKRLTGLEIESMQDELEQRKLENIEYRKILNDQIHRYEIMLEDADEQIKNFMNNNPQEIIFIDLDNNLRSENGLMSENDLSNLHDYLQITFGSYLTPKQDWQQLTFKKLWKTKHRIILMSSNPMFTRYYDILDKNQVVTSNGIAHYTTIKKLTAIQEQLNFPSDSKNDLMITPIYNWFDPERNSITQIETLNNDHLIFDYLSTIPESSPLNIIVGDRNYNNQLVDYTIQINSHR